MNRENVERLARQLLRGEVPLDQFVSTLSPHRTADLGEVSLDLDRQARCGFPEVVYGENKSVETLVKTCQRLIDEGLPVLATRVSADKAGQLGTAFPAGRYNAVGRTFRVAGRAEPEQRVGRVAVITAGTSDLPVAEEAAETVDWMGVNVEVIHDVGVAGPHRLRAHLDKIVTCDAVVVVAGFEGALPSVVGGYVPCPVIGVPTSVGYGASFGGLAALLGMLNSCASNVTVVNIDAGFRGGYLAGLIATRAAAVQNPKSEIRNPKQI
jgi:NCAIR mutase (PurE)-related protein